MLERGHDGQVYKGMKQVNLISVSAEARLVLLTSMSPTTRLPKEIAQNCPTSPPADQGQMVTLLYFWLSCRTCKTFYSLVRLCTGWKTREKLEMCGRW